MHTGVGFYGRDASVGGSSNVHRSGTAIEGDVRERIDLDQVNAIGGALNNSTIRGRYLHHTKVGVWLDGPMANLRIRNNVNVRPQHRSDDGLAMWSEKTEDANDTFDHNTVQMPVLANGIAIYGGRNITVSNNVVADPPVVPPPPPSSW